MSIANTLVRWVVQPVCTLIIGRACLAVFHAYGWYPEQQLARLLLATPGVLESELILWGLAAVIGATLWAVADYFFYRRWRVTQKSVLPKTRLRLKAVNQTTQSDREQLHRDIAWLANALERFELLSGIEREQAIERYERLKSSDDPVWTSKTARTLRNDFLHGCGIAIAANRRNYDSREDREYAVKLISESAEALNKLLSTTAVMPRHRSSVSHSPMQVHALKGRTTFDYSTNSGSVPVGDGDCLFKIAFSKASDRSIYMMTKAHTRHSNLKRLARVKSIRSGERINIEQFDSTSSNYNIKTGEHFLAENDKGYFLQGKIVSIQDDSRGSTHDEVVFEYEINSDGSAEFTAL